MENFRGSSDKILEIWKNEVCGIVEATDYEHHCLWQEYSKEYVEMYPDAAKIYPERNRVDWIECNPGYLETLPGKNFNTSISIRVSRINGLLCLFWHGTSGLQNLTLAEKWVHESFKNAKVTADPTNFHIVIDHLNKMT